MKSRFQNYLVDLLSRLLNFFIATLSVARCIDSQSPHSVEALLYRPWLNMVWASYMASLKVPGHEDREGHAVFAPQVHPELSRKRKVLCDW